MRIMRILTVICLSLFAMSCFAGLPQYSSSCQWIENHTPKDKTPKQPWVFVGDDTVPTNTYILHYHDGILLRDVIDATRYKSTNQVFVVILRSDSYKTGPVFFDYVKATEKPKFRLREQDVVWLMSEPNID